MSIPNAILNLFTHTLRWTRLPWKDIQECITGSLSTINPIITTVIGRGLAKGWKIIPSYNAVNLIQTSLGIVNIAISIIIGFRSWLCITLITTASKLWIVIIIVQGGSSSSMTHWLLAHSTLETPRQHPTIVASFWGDILSRIFVPQLTLLILTLTCFKHFTILSRANSSTRMVTISLSIRFKMLSISPRAI